MKLTPEHIITVKGGEGETDGTIILREPTTKEWNEFSAARYPVVKGKREMTDNSGNARIALFDELFIGAADIETIKGDPITAANLDEFPPRMKHDIVFRLFELSDQVALGNS